MGIRKGTSLKGFQRAIGLVVLAMTGLAALLLWLAVARGAPAHPVTHRGVLFGVWHFFYDSQAPSMRVLLLAVAVALFMAALVAVVERRIANRYRRSENAGETPLSPKIVMAATRGVFHGPVTVTVLVPAHNEAANLPATLHSLFAQSHAPHRVIVVADNCTDDTAQVARAHGAEVFETAGNTHKKGGALNQALADLLPGQGENDTVMVMDADTILDDGFLEAAVRRLTDDRALMAVGGLFHGEAGHGVIGQFQRNEYLRYSREIRRRRGRVFVLTGTASIFRPRALQTVAASRGTRIPGTPGRVYDTAALTEDNELTIALKSLGALIISPQECSVVTELMPGWRTLWNQRLRWQRGALENLGAYGIRPQTLRYWAQQLGIGYGVIALASYFVLFFIMLAASNDMIWFPFWLGLGGIFVAERVVTVWKGGWAARGLAVLIFPELFFDFFLDAVYVKGIVDISLGRQAAWKHVGHERMAEATR